MKKDIENILRILSEETKKIKKKKKKFSPVAITPFRRPMGSLFYMDAGVSESDIVKEGITWAGGKGGLFKEVPTKFDHLKWKLNELQKHFLDDFINIPDEALRPGDLEYASKRTGIPVESIKSIRNTYGKPELSYAKPDIAVGSAFSADHKGPTAKELGLFGKDLPKASGKIIQPNQNPEFRSKSFKELAHEAEMQKEMGGGLQRVHERDLPNFMYEWLMFVAEGSDEVKIKDSKLLNRSFSMNSDKYKYILFSIEVPIKENKIAAYDLMSNKELPELKKFQEALNEFNNTFGTNFIIEHQYTGEDGYLKVVLYNAQNTDGKNIFNHKLIDMTMTDEKRAAFFNAVKAMNGQ